MPETLLLPSLEVFQTPGLAGLCRGSGAHGPARYRLPRRSPHPFGPHALLACLACSLCALGLVGFLHAAPPVNLIGNAAAALLIGLALLFCRGYVEIEVDGQVLRRTNCLGPIRLSASCPLVLLRGFTLDDGWAGRHPCGEGGEASSCLFAVVKGGRRLLVAGGYPRSWLLALAADLTCRSTTGPHAPR